MISIVPILDNVKCMKSNTSSAVVNAEIQEFLLTAHINT